MSRFEFAQVMAYIAAAIGKPLSAEATEVYFELLGDLPLEVLHVTAKRVVLEHKWATFPTVAELREAAAETMLGEIKGLSPAEAWAMAWKAAGRIDLETEGSLERACAGLPPLVVEAMRAFSLPALVYGKEPVGIVRAQFVRMFEQLQARAHRQALLPDGLKRQIAAIGQEPAALPGPVNALLGCVGVENGKVVEKPR